MRVLVTWGSKMGGTAGIGETIAQALREEGVEVVARPAAEVDDLDGIDAAIIGGALYAFHWHHDAIRFVDHHVGALRRMPVWFFSSGPLDDSADRAPIAPIPRVRALMERVGALDHVTFGGRLPADARGIAGQMAKEHAGDWRNPARIRAWTADVARALPTASPGRAVEPPGRSVARLAGYGALGWAACALVMAALLAVASTRAALVVHAIAAPLIFAAVAAAYHRPRGAREPMTVALAFTGIVAVLDAVLVAGLVQGSPALLRSVVGFWLPLALIFAASWITGYVVSMLPVPKAPAARPATSAA